LREKLKIAFVTPYFPPTIGGIETYIYELVKRLSDNGMSVYVFASGNGSAEIIDGIKVFRLKAIDVNHLPLSPKIPYPISPYLMFKLKKIDLDIIHAHGHAFITSFEAALASQLIHKPFILTVHDIGIAYLDHLIIRGVRPIIDSTLVNYVFRHTDAVIAQNETTHTYALKFKPKRIVTIPQGVDFEKFKADGEEGEYVTFIAARLVPQKGGETFIRAVPLVLKEIAGVKFMVIGDGYQRGFLKKLAEDLGVEDCIDFVGSIPHRVVPKYLSQAKMVVFPSKIPTGLTLLEAAAMKKPIITTRNGWAEDALGETPLFLSTCSPEETAEAIIRLLKNPDERMNIGELVHSKVSSERSWDAIVSKHRELYDQIINGK